MQTTPVTTFPSAVQTRSDRGVAGMKSEDFFRLLVTELQQQDPLQPNKTADMIGQVSQIRSIELSKQLTDVLTQLSRQQHTAGAGELIGKYVTAALVAEDGSAVAVSGVVTAVRFDSDGSAVLELDTGQAVRASDVIQITTVENAARRQAAVAGAAADPGRDTATAAGKTQQTAREYEGGGLLPWLSLEGSFRL